MNNYSIHEFMEDLHVTARVQIHGGVVNSIYMHDGTGFRNLLFDGEGGGWARCCNDPRNEAIESRPLAFRFEDVVKAVVERQNELGIRKAKNLI